eukprot:2288014-Rhodomonas_salina.1
MAGQARVLTRRSAHVWGYQEPDLSTEGSADSLCPSHAVSPETQVARSSLFRLQPQATRVLRCSSASACAACR